MSGSNCYFLTCIQISQEASKMVWYSCFLKNFPQLFVIHTVKGFGIVNKVEEDIFSGNLCHHFMANRCGNSVNSDRLYFWGAPKSLQMVTEDMKLKDACYLEGKL